MITESELEGIGFFKQPKKHESIKGDYFLKEIPDYHGVWLEDGKVRAIDNDTDGWLPLKIENISDFKTFLTFII
jgi:hypothetical protein